MCHESFLLNCRFEGENSGRNVACWTCKKRPETECAKRTFRRHALRATEARIRADIIRLAAQLAARVFKHQGDLTAKKRRTNVIH